jgi:hypothetical protein
MVVVSVVTLINIMFINEKYLKHFFTVMIKFSGFFPLFFTPNSVQLIVGKSQEEV